MLTRTAVYEWDHPRDGSDAGELDKVRDAATAAGGNPILIAPKVGAVPLSDGRTVPADAELFGQPSASGRFCPTAIVNRSKGWYERGLDRAAI